MFDARPGWVQRHPAVVADWAKPSAPNAMGARHSTDLHEVANPPVTSSTAGHTWLYFGHEDRDLGT
jgi:hypothetical protein